MRRFDPSPERSALLRCALLLAVFLTIGAHPVRADDPLAAWNDGPAKQAIFAFVQAVTLQNGKDFVPLAERIAVFDNDGTLWNEQPDYVQAFFVFERVKALAPQHPEWKTTQPFQAVLEGDKKALAASGMKGIEELMVATHAGMTTDEFATIVSDWLTTARHPSFKKPFTELVYQPMLELLAFLRAHGFKTYIVSGGGVEFMRPWSERVYGIPPEQVIGSSIATELRAGPDGPTLFRLPKVDFIDDGPGKPVGIHKFIGRRPILAFGNSDGDQQMLEWTAAGKGKRFMGIVHHTDEKREWEYDRQSHVGKLDKALDEAVAKGWTVVDMKTAWKRVFPFQKE